MANVPNDDIYRVSYQAGKELTKPVDMTGMTPEQQRMVFDYYYQAGRKYIDENAGTYGEVVARPVDRRENYVKRCVGLPGQTLEIKTVLSIWMGRQIKNLITCSIAIW